MGEVPTIINHGGNCVLLCLIPDFYFLFIANLLLQDAIERIHVGQKYGDIHRGVFLIRGENVVLLGEFVS